MMIYGFDMKLSSFYNPHIINIFDILSITI